MMFADGIYFIDAGTGYTLMFTPEGNKITGGLTIGIDGGCKWYISSNIKHDEPPVHTEERRASSVSTDIPTSRTALVHYVQMTTGIARFVPMLTPKK